MKSFLVFLRIFIVGCLWGIVFTEGIRVIMLCNWHFDIFWPDHWRQFSKMWQAGWTPRAAKEWAFILLIITFIPMLFTGWWTLSMVAWEEIIWKILCYPYQLYMKLCGKQIATPITPSNRYGIVKRKSYKQIRPTGISTLQLPISDYGTSATSAPITPSTSALAGSSYAQPNAYPTFPTINTNSTPTAKKKTDVSETIDHALFKFDDDDDDFDLDIDSFEKAEVNKPKAHNSASSKQKSYDFDDGDDDFERTEKFTSRRKSRFDDDDEIIEEEERSNRRGTKRESKNGEEKEKRNTRGRNSDEYADKSATTRTRKSVKDGEKTTTSRSRKNDDDDNSEHRAPTYEALEKKGYDVLSNINVGGTIIDFVGVAEDQICCCLVDKESGDWLADEEMFNGEEPLWFSESSHRVSPVCKLNNAKKIIEGKLEDAGFEQKLSFYVVVQMANIINADDMFEVWDSMNIEVTRINRGAPKEIKLFSRQLSEAQGKLSKKELDALKNIFKDMK